MGLTQTTAPTLEPVTIQDAFDQCRIVSAGDEDLRRLNAMLIAARRWVERNSGRQLVQASWTWTLPGFPGHFEVPRPPLQSVTSIYYINMDGVSTLLAESQYVVDITQEPGKVTRAYGVVWPSTRSQEVAVTVIFKAGYGTSAGTAATSVVAVPETYKQAILMLAAHWYENREAVASGGDIMAGEIPYGVQSLLGMEETGIYA